jgi:tetratricopeptide (TPR) repeat protein
VLLSAIGRLLLQWGNLPGAERYFRDVEQLVKDSSKSAIIMTNRGLEYIGRDRYSDAVRAFEGVLELEPDNIWAANNRAVCWLYLRDLQRAITSLEQLIAANPEANLTVCRPPHTRDEIANYENRSGRGGL